MTNPYQREGRLARARSARSACARDGLSPGLLYGCDYVFVGAATADVSTHGGAHIVIAGANWLVHERCGRHDLPRSTVAALHSVMVEKCLLHGMQLSVMLQPFNRRDLVILVHYRESEAGIQPAAVHMNSACAALSVVTALLRAEEVQVLAQRIQKGHPRLQRQAMIRTIDAQCDRNSSGCTFRSGRSLCRRSFCDARGMRNGCSRGGESSGSKLGKERSSREFAEGNQARGFVSGAPIAFLRRFHRGIALLLHCRTPASGCLRQKLACSTHTHIGREHRTAATRKTLQRFDASRPEGNAPHRRKTADGHELPINREKSRIE